MECNSVESFERFHIPYAVLMGLCLAFCIFAEVIRLAKKEKASAKTAVGRGIIIGIAVWFGANFIGYDIHPKMKMVVLVAVFAASAFLMLSMINTKGLAVMLAAVIFLVFVVGCYVFDDAVADVEEQGKSYVCIYSKWTGIAPTHVYYFEKHFVFMKTRASFVADHGHVGVSWEAVPSLEPVEIYYFD